MYGLRYNYGISYTLQSILVLEVTVTIFYIVVKVIVINIYGVYDELSVLK